MGSDILFNDWLKSQRQEQCFKWKKISASTPLFHPLACELGGQYQQIIKYYSTFSIFTFNKR